MSSYPYGLDLGLVGSFEIERAIACFERGDAEGFASCGYPNDATLDLIVANTVPLKSRGIYEAALVQGYIGCKDGHYAWPASHLANLFKEADRNRLLKAGHSLPGKGPFRVFRGVCGKVRYRKVRGVSWTSSLDTACGFATRNAVLLGDPAIYTATVSIEDIFFYTDQRGEKEFVVWPQKYERLAMQEADMQAASKRHVEAVLKFDLEALAALQRARAATP